MLEKCDALVYVVQLKNAFKILYKGYLCNQFFYLNFLYMVIQLKKFDVFEKSFTDFFTIFS